MAEREPGTGETTASLAKSPPADGSDIVLDERSLVVDIRVRGGMPIGGVPPADWRSRPPDPPDVIIAIRGDGSALWSDAEKGFGPPFRRGKIDARELKQWFARRVSARTFEDDNLARSRVGPDAACRSITLRMDGGTFETCSWHRAREGGDTIVTAAGIVPRNGRDPEAVFAEQPTEFIEYVRHFDEVIASVRALLPEGEPVPDAEALAAVASIEYRRGDRIELEFAQVENRGLYLPDVDAKRFALQREAIDGKTRNPRLRVCFGHGGKVVESEVTTSSGVEGLDALYAETVRKWRIKPLRRDGVSHEVCTSKTFDLDLE